jgi:hypothetical protein
MLIGGRTMRNVRRMILGSAWDTFDGTRRLQAATGIIHVLT